MTNPTEEWQDAFGKQIADGTRNDGDLAAHFRYNPERQRVFRNGTRQLLQYQDISNYSYFDDWRSGEEDVFILSPGAGDTMTFKSAEQFRYTVGFVAQVTQALAISQDLINTNDRLIVGFDTTLGENSFLEDGYFLEYLPGHDSHEANIFIKRNDNVVGSKKSVNLTVPLTTFNRPYLDYNWYNVGEDNWGQTSTDSASGQNNEDLGFTSVQAGDSNAGPGGRGPISGNGHIITRIETDSSTTGLEVYVGSQGYVTKGNVESVFSEKWAQEAGLTPSQSGSWEPLFVIRRSPEHPNASVQLPLVEATSGPDAKIIAIACDPSKVLDGTGSTIPDSDFSTPEEHSKQVSVFETATTVDQFPGQDGTTGATQSNPGGYQLSGSSTYRKSEKGSSLRTKKGLLRGDWAVVIAKPEGTGSDFKIDWIGEQDK